MLGRLTIDALPFYSCDRLRRCAGHGRRRARGGGGHHLVRAMALPLERMADQRRPQADRHHVCDAGDDHADARLRRRDDDAKPAGDRAQLRRLPAARALRPDLQLPWHHHDLLHGDAVSDRADQYRGSAADRRARRRLPVHELGEPVAHHGRRRAGHGVAGDRQVLDRGLDRIPAVLRLGIQPGRRGRLLAVGDPDQRHRLDADRHQFHRHHLQAARARHDVHAHAAVHLDRPVHQRPDDLRLSRPDRGVRDCWCSTARSACTFSPMAAAAT